MRGGKGIKAGESKPQRESKASNDAKSQQKKQMRK
ncbi:hypothetical protein AJ85_11515 [Alkalihalobacillus alcalophilus ATCC 27647 = CGMCC 1.3604]|uniref:Uncharacterized protein n=1 Tax=Alkalihalobacillus alcalophilus ATCC 27647 = CGMCC 1.3604 TaxID=1218173 RepID=A0A4S4JYL7_ALKAL|nr:hypothetical protein AJ85_11515 [Alkalihalobacillus alcalophilus ATCC 27647 = CGMCC 1.3604]